MADLWYAVVDANGIVREVFCDDLRKPKEGDVPLDPKWYFGRAPGICISDPIHGDKYIVHNGRLYPRYDNAKELVSAVIRTKCDVDAYKGSPILSPKKKDKMSAAKKEAHDHIDQAVNINEIEHTRVCGY
jgi:hypothetical protein